MAILETVKLAARIKHYSLDDEINRIITWARSEMERAGVPHDIAISETEPLVTECIIQGVLKNISTDERIREAAERSFLYQLDNLRKHNWGLEPEPEPTPEPTPEPEPESDDEPGEVENGT